MKTIIAGGRSYVPTIADYWSLDSLNITLVISGKAKGADTFGEHWAKLRGIPILEFPADWDSYGKQAGPIRNDLMAREAQSVVLFPGNAGTNNMYKLAKKYKLVIHDWR